MRWTTWVTWVCLWSWAWTGGCSSDHRDAEVTPENGEVTPPENGEVTPPENGEVTPPANGEVTCPVIGQVAPLENEQVTCPESGKVTCPANGQSVCSQRCIYRANATNGQCELIGACSNGCQEGASRCSLPTKLAGLTYNSVHGSGADNAWLCSAACGLLVHWDGRQWTAHQLEAGATCGELWVFNEHDAWTRGNGLFHWDGVSWSRDAGPTDLLLRTWGTLNGEFFALGASQGLSSGPLFRRDGESWVNVGPAQKTYHKWSVWAGASDDIWEIHQQRQGLVHWDGQAWSEFPLPGEEIDWLWGLGADDVWAVEHYKLYQTRVLHWDGQSWSVAFEEPESIPTYYVTYDCLWSNSSDDLWVAASAQQFIPFQTIHSEFLIHFHNTRAIFGWEEFGLAVPRHIWGAGHNDVLACGTGCFQWNGQRWFKL